MITWIMEMNLMMMKKRDMPMKHMERKNNQIPPKNKMMKIMMMKKMRRKVRKKMKLKMLFLLLKNLVKDKIEDKE